MNDELVLPKELEDEANAILSSLETLREHLDKEGLFGSARLTKLACNHVRDLINLYKEEE